MFPTSRDDRYSAVKKLCCIERPVPSQVRKEGGRGEEEEEGGGRRREGEEEEEELVIIVFPTSRDNRYFAVRNCCIERPVSSLVRKEGGRREGGRRGRRSWLS